MVQYREIRAGHSQTIDQFLEYSTDLDLKRIRQLRERGHVFANDRPVLSNRRITPGTLIKVITQLRKPNQQLARVISVEDHYVAVEKKQPALTERADTLDDTTLQAWVRSWAFHLNPKKFPFAEPVHRLDKETTGVCIFATGKQKLKELNHEFEQRKVQKTYFAISAPGKKEKWTCDSPLLKTDQGMIVHQAGKDAYTSAHCRKKSTNYWLWEVRIKTGRTHQIRVHFAHNNIPLIGDTKYGGPSANRLFLHSQGIQFTSGKKNFESALPQEFLDLLKS